MKTSRPSRRVLYISAIGATQQFAVWGGPHPEWWVFDHVERKTVPLVRDEEGIRWVWGWKSKSARVLRVKAALT